MAETIAVIPARSGSTELPDKNIKLLNGKPLLAYSIETALSVKSIDRVIVSTDSQEYADIAIEYGAEVPFLRPSKWAQYNSEHHEYLKHLIENLGVPVEYVVVLLPTHPMRKPEIIEESIETIKADKRATALASVYKSPVLHYTLSWRDNGYMKKCDTNSFYVDKSVQSRQDCHTTYISSGYVYILRASHFMKSKYVMGNRVISYMAPNEIDIDTQDDFDRLVIQNMKVYNPAKRFRAS